MSFSEWKTYKIEELCRRIISGGTPSTTKKEYYGGDIPWLKTQEVNFNRIYDTDTKITKEGFENSSAKMIEPNSIIVAMYGATAAKLAINKIPLSTNQACCNLTVDEKKADYHFLYYYLRNEYSNLVNLTNGGAQQNLSSGVIKNFEIKAPDLKTQQRIASILSSLDDAIELNQQINKTLEEMAKAIFKEWFVDFNFPNATGKFQETEIGKIPVGWKVGKLGDIIINFDNKRVPISSREREKRTGIYPYYGAASIVSYIDDYIFDGTYLLMGEDGSVITENERPVLQYVTGKFWVNNHAHVLQGKDYYSTEFLYLLLGNTNIKSLVTGAVQPKINQGNMNGLEIIIPDKETVIQFQELVKPFFEQILQNEKENQSLINLRDTLLPKLMKGEIEING